MKICICGGGNLGHVTAGFIAAQGCHEVHILTRRPGLWSRELVTETPGGQLLTGRLAGVWSETRQAVAGADMVLLCLPGYLIRQELESMKAFLGPQAVVGSVVSSTGFFFEAMDVLPANVALFGFQRVPFISRITQYGHRASLLGYKSQLNVAIERTEEKETLRRLLEQLFKTPVNLLQNFYEASLSNSNPLLHPARLYDLWHDWQPGTTYSRIPLFYEEWTEQAAALYLRMDEELQALLSVLPVTPGSIASVLDYYESTDAVSLAEKLRSIAAFKGIPAPMQETGDGTYVPDFHSRYFTEDFPYGLAILHRLMEAHGIASPTISHICRWGMEMMNRHV